MTTDWKNSTALVTGASSGIGAEFAGQQAAHGVNLLLMARRADRLDALRGRLLERHPALRVDIIPADLAAIGATADLAAQLHEAGQHIDVLVNNAGVGFHRPFADEPADEVAAEIRLNCEALVDLTARFLPGMCKAQRGGHQSRVHVGVSPGADDGGLRCDQGVRLVLHRGAVVQEPRLRCSGDCAAPGATQTEFFDRSRTAFMTRGRQSPAQASKSAMKVATSDRQGLPAQRMPGQMNSWRGSARTTTCAWNKAANRQWRLRPRQALAPPARHLWVPKTYATR